MSEADLQKKLDTALARIAALESSRATAPAPAAPAIDRQAWTLDPIGSMQRAGLPVEHIAKVFVAHVMGDQAPPELRTLAAMGPQVSATQALSSELHQLRQRVDAYEAKEKQQAVRQSFSQLAVDKTKYPVLATAYARNPSAFEAEVTAHQGDAAALAERLESQLKALGITPPASTENAAATQVQSTQDKQAQQAHVNGGPVDTTPPPLPTNAANAKGVFTQEEHRALKDRIMKKYGSKAE